MSQTHWQPECDEDSLEARAFMLKAAREFFDSRGYLEVQTPSLSSHTASDPFLDSYALGSGKARQYLQTSPEFHMKRLLAQIPRPIYQICHAFRQGETGRLHNSEFTVVEWYAPGVDSIAMAELTTLLIDSLLEPGEVRRTSFQQLLRERHGVDIDTCDESALLSAAQRVAAHADRINALDCLYEHAVSFLSGRVLVHGFPSPLASLAAIGRDGVAERFELIIDGIEIANGCQELIDADEFRLRTNRNNEIRRDRSLPQVACDTRLEAALRCGLAPTSGVALGFDRLLMLKLGKPTIPEVLAFSDRTR